MPMSLRRHFVGSPRLLGLIVIVELPRKIRDRKQNQHERGERPECSPAFEETFAHAISTRIAFAARSLAPDSPSCAAILSNSAIIPWRAIESSSKRRTALAMSSGFAQC